MQVTFDDLLGCCALEQRILAGGRRMYCVAYTQGAVHTLLTALALAPLDSFHLTPPGHVFISATALERALRKEPQRTLLGLRDVPQVAVALTLALGPDSAPLRDLAVRMVQELYKDKSAALNDVQQQLRGALGLVLRVKRLDVVLAEPTTAEDAIVAGCPAAANDWALLATDPAVYHDETLCAWQRAIMGGDEGHARLMDLGGRLRQ